MSEWGRKEYPSAPSRQPVWAYGAFFAGLLFFVFLMAVQVVREWSFVERFYLPIYAKTAVRSWMNPKSQARYRLIDVVDAKKQQRLAITGEVESKRKENGEAVYVLTDEAKKNGAVRLVWDDQVFNDKPLHEYLAHWIYQDMTVWDYVQKPVYGAALMFVFLLFFALPKDRKNALERKNGRRLRGPELLRTAEFNRRHEADGIAFVNEEQTRMERLLRKNASRWVRIPRQREAMHFLAMGDSGSGKSAAIRQILMQAQERGESAIVYDPALEYVPQFYSPLVAT